MTPSFSRAVDPIFEYVLGLLDRIEQGEEPDPQQTQAYLYGTVLNRAEQELAHTSEWPLARAAFIYWIDEMLCQAPWQGRSWWVNNPLEVQLLKVSANRALQFFLDARTATDMTRLNALEVFYLCVILGFRGIYDHPDEHILDIGDHQLPATIDEWLRRTGEGIRLSPTPSLTSTGRLPAGAPPLGGFAFMTSALVLFAFAAVAFGGTAIWTFRDILREWL